MYGALHCMYQLLLYMSTLRLYKTLLYKHVRSIHITNHFFLLTCFFFAGVLRALDLFRLRALRALRADSSARALGAKADSVILFDELVRCDFLAVAFTTPTFALAFTFRFLFFPFPFVFSGTWGSGTKIYTKP